MILGDQAFKATLPAREASRLTIDGIFRSVARRRPDALALVDAANRGSFTDGEPRRLTYQEADRVVTAMAGRLRRMGLLTDAIVGIQLPNIVENILAMLAVWRAGMIAAPLPLLWRRADAVPALARIGAKALVSCGRVGAFQQGELALRAASEVFSIRCVCGFGKDLPDGIVPLDDLFGMQTPEPLPPLDAERQRNATAHVAVITFDATEDGPIAVARNHAQLLTGGMAILLESGLGEHATVLSTVAPSSFAGIGLTLLPCLLSGGTLVLHHPFDLQTLDRQLRDHQCSTLILPGPVALQLAASGAFAHEPPASVIAAWRTPQMLASSAEWHEPDTVLTDVSIFGEAALIPARRDADGRPAPLPFGRAIAPRHGTNAVTVAELVHSEAGTLAVRGPMVPRHAFPPGIEHSAQPHLRIGPDGSVDTRYGVDKENGALVLTAAPADIAGVGGYRFALGNLNDAARRIDAGATIATLPDPLLGQRLTGNAADCDGMRTALTAAGANPIVAAAFHD